MLKKSSTLFKTSRKQPVAREQHLFRPTDNPGIWLFGPLDLGPIFLHASRSSRLHSTRAGARVYSHLPPDRAYDWLRQATRLPETPQEFRDAVDLMNEQNLDTTKKAQLEDTIMNVFIEGMTPIEVMAKLRAAEEQVLIEQEKVRLEQEKVRLEQEERRIEQERMSELENELKRMRALIAEPDPE